VRLNREPAAFVAVANGSDALAARAKSVLERVTWPGKPGAAAPVAPLTPAEEQRFRAGQEIYRNICQGCHQPDGRGQDRIAPTLIGSPLALGPAGVAARVLLHGKEGPIGLMPPIGASLDDEQLAGVLTYIRREWGQSGTPVDAATITSVRKVTADRKRPWTHDELTKMAEQGK
jgi:mono/diheme cytochrome c family protein